MIKLRLKDIPQIIPRKYNIQIKILIKILIIINKKMYIKINNNIKK